LLLQEIVRAKSGRKTFLLCVDAVAQDNRWSEARESLNYSGQLGFAQCERNKSQGSGGRAAATDQSIAETASLDQEPGAGTKFFTLIDWIVEINRVWARDSTGTLNLARVVSAAKTHLRRQYGQWSQLWKTGQKIPVSKSTADRLAVIGVAMGELDSATSLNVPRGWNILYCLARFDRETLEPAGMYKCERVCTFGEWVEEDFSFGQRAGLLAHQKPPEWRRTSGLPTEIAVEFDSAPGCITTFPIFHHRRKPPN